jgi:hypothetical protein
MMNNYNKGGVMKRSLSWFHHRGRDYLGARILDRLYDHIRSQGEQHFMQKPFEQYLFIRRFFRDIKEDSRFHVMREKDWWALDRCAYNSCILVPKTTRRVKQIGEPQQSQ